MSLSLQRAASRADVLSGLVLLFLLIGFVAPAPTAAQAPVKPGVERVGIEIRRGLDIVQPPTVYYKRVYEDASRSSKLDSIGVLRVPRPSDLDAIEYRDRSRGFTVNLQHAMVVSDGLIVDVDISQQAKNGSRAGTPLIREEVIILRPPDDDAFDVAIPDVLECVDLKPGSEEDLASRGSLYTPENGLPAPCKQVQGVETVVDVAAWYEASMTNPRTGARASREEYHDARELRGWLKSRAPGGEQVRFVIVVTPPERERFVFRERPGPENLSFEPVNVVVNYRPVSEAAFELVTSLAALSGPNRSDLPGNPGPRYDARRVKGDALTTLRWNVSSSERYELHLFGSTQAAISDDGPGSHHDVPYGASVGARFGDRDDLGIMLRIEGSYEDDPFQRNTLSSGDQRIRIMAGVDHGHILMNRTQWHVALGPTYFLDRVNIWENRSDGRQLGYSIDGSLTRKVQFLRIPSILSVGGKLHHSFGYIQDRGNGNFSLIGRVAAKPRLSLGGTMLAAGPVAHVSYTESRYADIPGFSETNVQVGLELTSWVSF